jgi:agmatinase
MFELPETLFGLPAGPPGPGCRAAILGVPYDCGIHPFRVGSREGPTEVRRQSRLLQRHEVSLGAPDPLARLNAVDCGNVALLPGRPLQAFPAIQAAAESVLAAGAVPIGIGGDGSVSLPLMRAAAKFHPGLVALHVDSHTDAYEPGEDDPLDPSTQFTHAANEGLVDVPRSWHVGIRGFTSVPGIIARARSMGFGVVTTEDLIRRGIGQTMAEFRDGAARRPVYLCWDMDIFDPAVAPGVCTPTWGGLTAREGIELMRACAGLNIVAMDFNTVSPAQDEGGRTAFLCAHMIMEAMLLLA